MRVLGVVVVPHRYTCPWCGETRHTPANADDGYCGRCRRWHNDPPLAEEGGSR